jgi:hypothetical protein
MAPESHSSLSVSRIGTIGKSVQTDGLMDLSERPVSELRLECHSVLQSGRLCLLV